MTWYKVLLDGKACHGGDLEYSLPVQQPDGSWQPGEWHTMSDSELVMCKSGFHVTTAVGLHKWWKAGADVYLAELGDHRLADGEKVASSAIRLMKRLSADDLRQHNILIEGMAVVIQDDHWIVDRSAGLKAYGTAKVRAMGKSKVWAHDDANIQASDDSTITATGRSQVCASDQAKVTLHSHAKASCFGNSTVRANEQSRVNAYGRSAKVYAYDQAEIRLLSSECKVEAYDTSLVISRYHKQLDVTLHDKAVLLDYASDQIATATGTM